METQTKPRTLEPTVTLDGIGAMIEDDHRFEMASALCLLSIARSQERIAEATERLAASFDSTLENAGGNWPQWSVRTVNGYGD